MMMNNYMIKNYPAALDPVLLWSKEKALIDVRVIAHFWATSIPGRANIV